MEEQRVEPRHGRGEAHRSDPQAPERTQCGPSDSLPSTQLGGYSQLPDVPEDAGFAGRAYAVWHSLQ